MSEAPSAPGELPLHDDADDAALLAALGGLRNRYLGGMLGLAACDALAQATQHRRAGSFMPVGDLLGGGPFDLPRGAWSDDTAMALCLAESLLECNGCHGEDQLARYARWQREGHLACTGQCVGITAGTARAIAGGAGAGEGDGEGDGQEQGAEPLVRLLPVVLLAWGDRRRLNAWAATSARATGASPVAIDATRWFAAQLQAALAGARLERVLRPPRRRGGATPCDAVVALASADPALKPDPTGLGAIDVLAQARWCLATTTTFRAGALQAANLGGDSDQVCAVYGQLAGLHYGAEAIPRGWRDALACQEQLVDTADQLLREALLAIDVPEED